MRIMMEYAQHFQRLYQRSFQTAGEELGLSQLEMGILLFLRNNPELNTARDVVALRGFAKSNVSSAIEKLADSGWLRVEPDPESRRVKRLVLLPGREMELDTLTQCQEACFEAMLSDFSPDERDNLRSLMARLDAKVQRALEERK